MGTQKIYPTCRICEKLNDEMTHCAVFGPISPDNINNTALGGACAKSGDYVRLLHARPNEYNYGRGSSKTVDEQEDEELLVFDASDEAEGFKIQNGITLEEWAKLTFGEKTTKKV
ncbi:MULTISPECIES: hypothetical protein [Paenibacillus]|jgi:hypothetical protein|uniref:Uncharacterized protein n=1 Tax=Paenibacillus lautus TaxID=1401 RepID=A0A385TXI3_PAELA|nr:MULTISPECIES: hypothetical protein [Paenibacillus]AWP25310.1 hypothetical protein B9D94_01115 [Paenibacillus sp. Cedars]AYB48173.1 hypothetical protein D5F53_33210 [Paenibacillus lautus]MBX4152483.1 hypothetical protein [Paenibacillus lautus]VTR32023.1 Uncharacterised protein [Actinobacillus pleuropneumoniae]